MCFNYTGKLITKSDFIISFLFSLFQMPPYSIGGIIIKYKGKYMVRWVKLEKVIGTDAIPARAALVLGQAFEKAIKNGDISERNRWQLIEYLAADYLLR